jgi:hypothetical protein
VTAQQERKGHIRAFFKHYTDERLAQLLAHAQDGKLAYDSCCCFIGVATVDHALKPKTTGTGLGLTARHYLRAKTLDGAVLAEEAYRSLPIETCLWTAKDYDDVRRRILIPMVRAEIRRRDKLRQQSTLESETKMERTDGILQAV